MFKKAVEAKSHQRLSGADRKKLKRTIKDRFPRASDADIDNLLPPKVRIFCSFYCCFWMSNDNGFVYLDGCLIIIYV